MVQDERAGEALDLLRLTMGDTYGLASWRALAMQCPNQTHLFSLSPCSSPLVTVMDPMILLQIQIASPL